MIGLLSVIPRDAPPERSFDALVEAARRGGCVLRRDSGAAPGRDLDVMQPPTFGPPAAPAATGVYSHAPRTTAMVGSLRHGIVVLLYRSDTPRQMVLELRRVRSLAPSSSIVAPDGTGMRYAVAATAWGRLLGCPRPTESALAAVRTFAVTYRGRGPDAG
jgi:hypothetical protein